MISEHGVDNVSNSPDWFTLLLWLLVAGIASWRVGRTGPGDSTTRRNLLLDQSSISLLKKCPSPIHKRTSFCVVVSTAGKDDSNPAISSGAAAGVVSVPPPSKSSPASASGASATWSCAVANCSASSPRTARSRARKSSLSEPPLVSTGSVWPGYLQLVMEGIDGGVASTRPSLTSREVLQGRETVRHLLRDMRVCCRVCE